MLRVTAVAAAVLALLTACGSGATESAVDSSATTTRVAGAVLVNDATRYNDDPGSECWTSGNRPALPTPSALDAIKKDAQVVVTDEDGKTVGVGTLAAGVVESAGSRTCVFGLYVGQIPVGPKFYKLVIGNLSRQLPADATTNLRITFP